MDRDKETDTLRNRITVDLKQRAERYHLSPLDIAQKIGCEETDVEKWITEDDIPNQALALKIDILLTRAEKEAWIEEVLREYKECKSVREVSRGYGISEFAVRKILISNGIYPSGRSKEIADAVNSGMSHEDIIKTYGISHKTLSLFLPYQRGSYAIGPKSVNAYRVRKSRKK